MSAYGVPTHDLGGVLPWSWAEERLRRNRNYWVVTANETGRPHALPVWGVWFSDPDRFVFSCAPTSRKARNLAKNPQVCVATDDTVECVSVEGSAAVVLAAGAAPDSASREVAARYAQKYEPDAAKRVEMVAFVLGHLMVELTPARAFGIIEREDDFARRATRWVWGD